MRRAKERAVLYEQRVKNHQQRVQQQQQKQLSTSGIKLEVKAGGNLWQSKVVQDAMAKAREAREAREARSRVATRAKTG